VWARGAILHNALIRQTWLSVCRFCGVCFIRWCYVNIALGSLFFGASETVEVVGVKWLFAPEAATFYPRGTRR